MKILKFPATKYERDLKTMLIEYRKEVKSDLDSKISKLLKFQQLKFSGKLISKEKNDIQRH